MPEIPITVMQNPAGITITPTSATVLNGPDEVVLVWNAQNDASFPENDYFEWKGTTVGRPPVTRVSSSKLQSAPYTNDGGGGGIWQYRITVGSTPVDPEINNQPPSGDYSLK